MADIWPDLPFDEWKDTCATLQLWTQIVGKVRLKLAPMVNNWWQVTLYVTATGLTTSAMPWRGRLVQIDFDFLDHVLWLRLSDGSFRQIMLRPISVAEFYGEVMEALELAARGEVWPLVTEKAPLEQAEAVHQRLEKGLVTGRAALLVS